MEDKIVTEQENRITSQTTTFVPDPPVLFRNNRNFHRESVEAGVASRSTQALDVNKQCREIILRAVSARSSSETDKKWLLCIMEVSPKLQGKLPRCGLSALSMATEMLRLQKHPCPRAVCTSEQDQPCELDNLLTLAQSRGFSSQGEMFCAENMAQLAKEFYGCNSVVITDGFEDCKIVVSELFKGSAVLVPYDADRNHEPCMENGHRAHWVLLTGVLCELHNDSFDWTKCIQDVELPILFHTIPSPAFMCHCNPRHIYFCAKQGKSRHTAVWSLDSLKKSNANLFELDPQKGDKTGLYILPQGGVRAGLCTKIVIISDQDIEL